MRRVDARRLRDDVRRHRRRPRSGRSRRPSSRRAYQQALRTATATGARRRRAAPARAAAGGSRCPCASHAPVRHAGAATTRCTVAESAGERARRLVALAGVPRPARRRAADAAARRCRARATLLARDGSVLAEGPAGTRRQPAAEATRARRSAKPRGAVVGDVGPDPRRAPRRRWKPQGVPRDGAGRAQRPRAGARRSPARARPGGELLAGSAGARPSAAPRPAPRAAHERSRRRCSSAAVAALGGQLGGIVAMQPSTGQILAVAGIGLDGLQPPGSTFKMITLTGVLDGRTSRTPARSSPTRPTRRSTASS